MNIKREDFRSDFEFKTAQQLEALGVDYEYETQSYDYVIESTYTPDFIFPNGVIIENKGVLTPADRRKMRAVKEQYPDLDIRFLFQRGKNKLNKNSKTTYLQWAEKHGFPSADGKVPSSWITPQPPPT